MRGHGVDVGASRAGGAHRQRRPAVLGAEGIDVEGEGGGGGHASRHISDQAQQYAHPENLLTVVAGAFPKVRRVAISPG
jgi:hypothetical protein